MHACVHACTYTHKHTHNACKLTAACGALARALLVHAVTHVGRAGGVPVAVYGLSQGLSDSLRGRIRDDESDTGGIGGTLAGNALSIAAMRATLEHVLTDEAFRCGSTAGCSCSHAALASWLAAMPLPERSGMRWAALHATMWSHACCRAYPAAPSCRHMIALGERFEKGVQSVIDQYRIPFIVKRLGCRVEYWPRSTPPRNGAEAAAAIDAELDR